ncbi:MAG: HEAT repeat domain-containing protein [Myxococcales bacterium]|nr:HEAT repeat domain-containing protein [Myxococcales bacterium]
MSLFKGLAGWSAISVSLLMLGCNESKSTGAAPSASASASPLTGAQAWLADETKPLTPEVYEELVLGLAKCQLNERGIDPRCEAYRDLKKARSRNTSLKDIAGLNATVGKKLIKNENPAVRWQAAQLLKSVFGSTPAVQELVLKAAETEKEPAVLISLVRVVGSQHRDNPKIKELLLKLADHESEHVRQEAMSWFLTPFGKGVEGTFDKVLEHVDNDKSMNVRRFLCGRLYGSEDERAIPVFEKYLNGKDTDPKLYEGCWQGVISAWTGFPKPESPSKQAYELTMKVLEKKPRTRTSPPWTSFRNLRAAKTDFPERDKASQAWLEKVKPWYKQDRLLKALDSIVLDKEAYWMTRTAALDVMRDLGVEQKKFEALEKKYAKAEKDDVHVKRKIEEILRRINVPVEDPRRHFVGRPGGPPSVKHLGTPPGERSQASDPHGPRPANPHARPSPRQP